MTIADASAAPVTTDTDTDTDAVTLVTVDAAASLAGVSPRTVRRWIQKGFLPSQRDPTGHLVSPADLPAAKANAGHGRGHGRDGSGHGRGHGHELGGIATDAAATDLAAVNPQAKAQLEAIRDEWLSPLVTRIEELSRENGRLAAERDAAHRERDELRRRVTDMEAEQRADASSSRQHAPGAAAGADGTEEPRSGLRAWWRRLLGLP